jgi:hypothetical protein
MRKFSKKFGVVIDLGQFAGQATRFLNKLKFYLTQNKKVSDSFGLQSAIPKMQAPVIVMNTNMERESGRKAQLSNINAAKVRSTLLPNYSRSPAVITFCDSPIPPIPINSSHLIMTNAMPIPSFHIYRQLPMSFALVSVPDPCSRCCWILWEAFC